MTSEYRTAFHHRERRYLLSDEAAVTALVGTLTARGMLEQYSVHTRYYDVAGGTWSLSPRQRKRLHGNAAAKWRLRTYDEDAMTICMLCRAQVRRSDAAAHLAMPGWWGARHVLDEMGWKTLDRWWEVKTRGGDGMVRKHRAVLAPERDLEAEGFHQVADVRYERQAWEHGDLRVTIDCNVRTDSGRTLGPLTPLVVVEVKGDAVPGWLSVLLPREARGFAKSKWALREQRRAAKAERRALKAARRLEREAAAEAGDRSFDDALSAQAQVDEP